MQRVWALAGLEQRRHDTCDVDRRIAVAMDVRTSHRISLESPEITRHCEELLGLIDRQQLAARLDTTLSKSTEISSIATFIAALAAGDRVASSAALARHPRLVPPPQMPSTDILDVHAPRRTHNVDDAMHRKIVIALMPLALAARAMETTASCSTSGRHVDARHLRERLGAVATHQDLGTVAVANDLVCTQQPTDVTRRGSLADRIDDDTPLCR